MRMLSYIRSAGVAVVAAVAVAALAAPQPGGTIPTPLPTPVLPISALSNVWRLDPASHFADSSGIVFIESVKFRGTANLTRSPQSSTAVGQVYQVSDLNWLITPNLGDEFYASGWGEYRVTPSVGMLQVIGHRMIVHVKWGSDTNIRHFDSGLIPMANSQVGRTVDIVMHEVFPTDANWPDSAIDPARPTLRLKAAAVPLREITPYAAPTNRSEFLNGCYEPCMCPIAWQAMEGRFGVVALPGPVSHLATAEWALVNMHFNVRTPATTPTPTADPRRFAGAGILQQFPPMGATIAPRQRMRADVTDSLTTLVAQPQRFDSGLVERTVAWPNIDIAIADNNFFCYNRVLHIAALPLRRAVSVPAPQPIGLPVPVAKP